MSVIVWPTESPLQKNPELVLEEFKTALRGKVSAAYIFGSLARGELHSTSDVDLIVVKETDTPFPNRCREFDELWNIYPRLDLLVYNSAEFAAMTTDPPVGFWRSVVAEMVRII